MLCTPHLFIWSSCSYSWKEIFQLPHFLACSMRVLLLVLLVPTYLRAVSSSVCKKSTFTFYFATRALARWLACSLPFLSLIPFSGCFRFALLWSSIVRIYILRHFSNFLWFACMHTCVRSFVRIYIVCNEPRNCSMSSRTQRYICPAAIPSRC